jgi:hypothetical protein
MNSGFRAIAICGGGNGGHALAVTASKHFEGDVRWLVGSPEKAHILERKVFSQSGLQGTGAVCGRAHRVTAISSEANEIIPGADLVLIVVPAFEHARVLRRIAPYLEPDALVGALPARGGFEFEAAHLRSGRAIFGLQTLPWSTRVKQPGELVHFTAVKRTVLMAAMPANRAPEIAGLLTSVLGTNIAQTGNFLNMTLGNPGQIIHPGVMYGLFGKWSGETYPSGRVPYFYRDTTDESGAVIDELSADVLAVAAKIAEDSAGALDLRGVLSILDWWRLSYPVQTGDSSSIASCFRTGPSSALAPMLEVEPGKYTPNFGYRYLTEDVPYGLVITKAIAQLARIGTPAIDTVLKWAQRKLRASYIVRGEFNASAAAGLPIPQNYGIASVQKLVEFYAPVRTTAGAIDAAQAVAS